MAALCDCRCSAECHRANGTARRSADSARGPGRARAVAYSLAHGYLGNDASARAIAHWPVARIGVGPGGRRPRGRRGSTGKPRDALALRGLLEQMLRYLQSQDRSSSADEPLVEEHVIERAP